MVYSTGVCGEEDCEEGDKGFMATKPWMGSIKKPTKHFSYNPQAPSLSYQIERVKGYRAKDKANNIFCVGAKIIYYAAACVIIEENGQQKVLSLHQDDIISMDVDSRYIAAGELGLNPIIFIWSIDTLDQRYSVMHNCLKRGVRVIKLWGDLMLTLNNDD